jgi:hypothetical protein
MPEAYSLKCLILSVALEKLRPAATVQSCLEFMQLHKTAAASVLAVYALLRDSAAALLGK